MDPSALIFVALAVAWAVYLIPKALEHHEEGARTRTVERFSARLRVLARREPVSRRKARLVKGSATGTTTTEAAKAAKATAGPITPDRTASRPTPVPQLTAAQHRARRQAAARAARRRLRVVTLILLANAAVATLAYLKVVDRVWCAVPVGVLVVWLVACRLMVRRERAELRRPRGRIPAELPPDKPRDATGEISRVDSAFLDQEPAEDRDPESWDPVSVPLPTYVSKPMAQRTVSTIDLDSTGVWSSGRSAADSRLAREAEAAERPNDAGERRASGA
ncbi:MAG TPA: hypothetical protein VFV89_11045 [Nocardioides sp.]|uniref:divisome protein SepX/GlpR n=1 Tax=Nocardioides sp. TaxID=35761 RepID=UPI002E357E46|nr:hypothetical protein [Nocardioides sp.]HEX5088335.1 hypothetical protein [Nocardioides sp.]